MHGLAHGVPGHDAGHLDQFGSGPRGAATARESKGRRCRDQVLHTLIKPRAATRWRSTRLRHDASAFPSRYGPRPNRGGAHRLAHRGNEAMDFRPYAHHRDAQARQRLVEPLRLSLTRSDEPAGRKRAAAVPNSVADRALALESEVGPTSGSRPTRESVLSCRVP